MSTYAMKLALELFEQFGRDSRLKYEHQAIYKTIVALKEALAKQEQGEPVECFCDSPSWCNAYNRCHRITVGFEPNKEPVKEIKPIGYADFHISSIFDLPIGCPLYTTPYVPEGRQQRTAEQSSRTLAWVGLTDIEINDLVHSHDDFDGLWEFADAVEAKLKEKNA
jgi:hypothetical protein